MTNYVNTLLTAMIVCQIAVMILPRSTQKPYVKLIVSLVILLTIFSPLTKLAALAENAEIPSVQELPTAESQKFAAEAYAIMSYVSEEYSIDPENITATVIVSDSDEAELHLTVNGEAKFVLDKIESDLSARLENKVYVFGEENDR